MFYGRLLEKKKKEVLPSFGFAFGICHSRVDRYSDPELRTTATCLALETVYFSALKKGNRLVPTELKNCNIPGTQDVEGAEKFIEDSRDNTNTILGALQDEISTNKRKFLTSSTESRAPF